MKKSELFTILVAGILALFILFGFYIKKHNTITNPKPNQEITTESPSSNFSEDKISTTTEQITSEKNILTEDIVNSSKARESIAKKSEPKKISLQQIETKPIEDEACDKTATLDSGIIHDKETGTIIITREFKIKSPAKYSFK